MSNLRYFNNIAYGNFKDLDVLIDPDGNNILVTYPTIEKVLGYQPEHAHEKLGAKKLKAFLGKDLMHTKKSVNAIDTKGRQQKMTAVPFDTFLAIVHFEAFEGKDPARTNARSILLAGFADSFSSLILEQCGITLTKEQRLETVNFYLTRYHAFQDWVRDTYIATHGVSPSQEYYRSIAVAINQHLFGKPHFKCDRLSNAGNAELRRIENLQMHFMETNIRKNAKDPLTAINQFLSV
jgi:hypothetical protein